MKGAVASGVLAKEDVLVYDIKESARKAAAEFGLKVAKDDEDVTANSDVTLLAVKPQQMSACHGADRQGTARQGDAVHPSGRVCGASAGCLCGKRIPAFCGCFRIPRRLFLKGRSHAARKTT